MKFLNSLIFFTFAISSNLLFYFGKSFLWLFTDTPKDPVSVIVVILIPTLIILLNIGIIIAFRKILNKSFLLSPLFSLITMSTYYFMEDVYLLIYMISFVGIIVCSVILFAYVIKRKINNGKLEKP